MGTGFCPALACSSSFSRCVLQSRIKFIIARFFLALKGFFFWWKTWWIVFSTSQQKHFPQPVFPLFMRFLRFLHLREIAASCSLPCFLLFFEVLKVFPQKQACSFGHACLIVPHQNTRNFLFYFVRRCASSLRSSSL